MEISSLISIAGIGIGGVIWAVRQEGRLNAHDDMFVANERVIDQRLEANRNTLDQRHQDLSQRLERIERKLDNLHP